MPRGLPGSGLAVIRCHRSLAAAVWARCTAHTT
jgi:hypothetical protein